MLFFGVLGVVLGGRFGYILFYKPLEYLHDPVRIFFVWEGGMSFHGGVIGIVIATILFAKKNNQNAFLYLDVVALVAPIGIFFGRIANFINSELYGTITNLPWAVTFIQIDNQPRHPSQIYEALLEGLILFLVLLYFRKRGNLSRPGLISGLFLVFYSIFRFIIEFLRVPDDQLGYLIFNLTMGQLISFVFLIIGLIIFFLKKNEQAN